MISLPAEPADASGRRETLKRSQTLKGDEIAVQPHPSPLLTIEGWEGTRGQTRVTATTKILQTEGIRRKRVTARGR